MCFWTQAFQFESDFELLWYITCSMFLSLRDIKDAFGEVSSEFELVRSQQRLRANSTEEEGVINQSLGTYAMFGSVSRLVCGRNISGSPFTSGGQANR